MRTKQKVSFSAILFFMHLLAKAPQDQPPNEFTYYKSGVNFQYLTNFLHITIAEK